MNFGQTASPFWIGANIPVGGGMKVSMFLGVTIENDAGHLAASQFVQ